MRLQLFVDKAEGTEHGRITTTSYLSEADNIYSLMSYMSRIMRVTDGFIRRVHVSPTDQFKRRFIYVQLGREHHYKTNYYII